MGVGIGRAMGLGSQIFRRFGGASMAVLVILCAGSLASLAKAEGVSVQRSIPFASGSNATDAVKRECQLETKIPAYLAQYDSSVTLVDSVKGAKGRVLQLEIAEVFAPGGGGMTGTKRVVVTGKLYENGKLIGNFRAQRGSTGGYWGGYKGTCVILQRCAKSIGKDIANWLKAPTKDASIGE